MKDISSLIINEDSLVMDAIRGLSYTKHRCLLVVSPQKKLIGVLSEGDILRAILNGTSIYSSITNLFRKDFKYLTKNDNLKALSLFKEYGISIIPIVDKSFYHIQL